ncbi:MAG: arsenite methyltransferase, partial [Anaerolineaceae bacterium]
MTNQTLDPTHRAVQEHYAKYARETGGCCGSKAEASAKPNELYPSEILEGIPADIANFSAGSGDPISLASLKPGETVLDLGSGGGLDCFVAARQVGEGGRVIGVDMTPEMLTRARSQAAKLDLRNVEFREGLLESLPVDDNSIDVIMSNCVINLSPDKPQVFREMFRVLKPGGRIAVSDPVANRSMPRNTGPAGEDWCGCTSGALSRQEYVSGLEKVGFEDIHLVADSETVIRMVDGGQITLPESRSREQLLHDLDHLESLDQQVVVPHRI